MKVYNDFKEVPEYIEAQGTLQTVYDAVKKAEAVMEENAQFILAGTNRLQQELNAAEEILDTERAQLVAEEMRGGSTTETSQRVYKALAEVERLTNTIAAFSRSGGVALRLLNDKINDLIGKRGEAEGKVNAYKYIDSGFEGARMNPKVKVQRIKEWEKVIVDYDTEIASLRQAMEILLANQKKHGKLITADGDTAQAAADALMAAGSAWAKRNQLKQQLIEQRDTMQKAIKDMTKTLYSIEDAIRMVNPDSAAEVIWASKIAVAAAPDAFTEINKYWPREMSGLSDQAKYKVKREVSRIGESLEGMAAAE